MHIITDLSHVRDPFGWRAPDTHAAPMFAVQTSHDAIDYKADLKRRSENEASELVHSNHCFVVTY